MIIRKKSIKIIAAGIVFIAYLALSFCLQAQSNNLSNNLAGKQRDLAKSSTALSSAARSSVSKDDEKMVVVNVVNFGRKNPFKPYKRFNMVKGNLAIPADIPPPPVFDPSADNQLKDLMDAKVSGILYDPSGKSVAIINIKGADYMVRQYDSLYGFTIRNITKNYVTISYGNNIYTVSVGQVIGQISTDPVTRNNQNFGGMGYRLPSINPGGF